MARILHNFFQQNRKQGDCMNRDPERNRGISLLDVAMAFAVCSLLVSFTVPSWFHKTVRHRVEASLAVASEARQALENTCAANPRAVVRDNLDAGYFYNPAGNEVDHARKILLGADCAQHKMAVVLWTAATGAAVDPVLEWSSDRSGAQTQWTCSLVLGDPRHAPGECRAAEDST